jgi:transposase
MSQEQATAVDVRERRGLALAATSRIRNKGGMWLVPSASGGGQYVVEPGPHGTCTCPDFETRKLPCKHVYALAFVRGGIDAPKAVPMRPTYTQDWPVYNEAQTPEKERVEQLLRDLCANLPTVVNRTGRPRIPASDVVTQCVLKVYSTLSGRRVATEFREAGKKGVVGKVMSYNAMFFQMKRADLTPILLSLVEESAAPLAAVETKFAVDSTGFSTCSYARWFDFKYGRPAKERVWIKLHAAVGTKTNVITSVRVTEQCGADSPELPALVDATAKRFDVREVSADKGYLSRENLEHVVGMGAAPYVPFKKNSVADAKGPVWRELFRFYQQQRDDFRRRYHVRSNVEATFSMLKRKFGPALRSRDFTAQVNELLCKVIAHNLAVLVMSAHHLEAPVTFWTSASSEADTPVSGQA